MELPISAHDVEYAETYLAAGDIDGAQQLLERFRELIEDYAREVCADTSKTQWFSFADPFERLAYRRVEKDPRKLEQVAAPFDRVYADLAFVYIRRQDFTSARDALMQAVRWNPMNCTYRLDLAEIFRALGDAQEWAALSFSVIERTSDARLAARAYANMATMFLDAENADAAEGCRRLAFRLAPTDQRVVKLMNRMQQEAPEAAEATDDHVMGELGLQGVPTQPNAEIAICLLMCASDAAAAGDSVQATDFTVRARNLVGTDACKALVKLIHETDAEMAAAEGDGAGAGTAGDASGTGDTAPGTSAPQEA